MSDILSTVRGALTLDIPTLVRFREAQDVFRRGIIILILVGLVLGAVQFAVGLIGSVAGPSAEAELAQMSENFDRVLEFMPPEAAVAFEEQFLSNFKVGIQIGREIAALPTPLPKVIGSLFTALGAWLSQPLAMLGGFLAYGIWVMLAAKLLGGTGRLQEFLGTAALSSVPYLLLVLGWVPCLGSVLGFVAWVWSLVIWVAATAVAHGWAAPLATAEGDAERYDVNWGKAILAVILPVLALVVLVIVVLGVALVLGLIAAVLGSGN
jgi:hypothetical protein